MIRQLARGERVPDFAPARYPSSHGYIRLRWKIGTNSYVEVYEHRVFDGVVTDADEVHHDNRVKHDNRPENLVPLSSDEHHRLHNEQREPGEFAPYRSRAARDKAMKAAARREARRLLSVEMRAKYEAGMSTVAIAAEYGIDAGGVSRRLRQVGTKMRHVTDPKRKRRDTGPSPAVRAEVHARSGMCCERCGSSLVWGGGEMHHRRPRKMGGSSVPETNLPSNLVDLCSGCHGWVESHPDLAEVDGWHVRPWRNPADVPIRLFTGELVWLSD